MIGMELLRHFSALSAASFLEWHFRYEEILTDITRLGFPPHR